MSETSAFVPLAQPEMNLGSPMPIINVPQLNEVGPWAVDMLFRHIKSWPDTFVGTLEAPFIHSTSLASLLLPLESAFGTCATYMAKTEHNRHMVLPELERKVNQLMAEQVMPHTPEAHLANLQALLLLHRMQLWDGDARQRVQVELHSPILESWAAQLQDRLIESAMERGRSPTWDEWIQEESARRTILKTFISQGIYETIKYCWCSYVSTMTELLFTVSDKPWSAPSFSSWKHEVAQGEGWVNTYGSFSQGLFNLLRRRPTALLGCCWHLV